MAYGQEIRNGFERRGLQPRLVSSDCLLHRLDKVYKSGFLTRSTKRNKMIWALLLARNPCPAALTSPSLRVAHAKWHLPVKPSQEDHSPLATACNSRITQNSRLADT